MVSSLAIVGKIRAYLGGQMDLHSFREWMVESHLEMQSEKAKPESEAADQDAARLLAELEGRYAEFSDEFVSESIWRRRIAGLIAPIPQSAESYLLTFFYTAPSGALQLNSEKISKPFQNTGNPLNSQSNYREPEVIPA
jgi:hypothetical protein